MPLLCSGRPTSTRPCNDETRPKPVFLAAVDTVRNFLRERQAVVAVSGTGKLGDSANGIVHRRRIQTAESYMAARLAGRTDDVLRLVADDVLLESSRDGKVSGKEHFRNYLGRVKPTGTWKKATWNRSIGKAEVLGNVKILMVNIGVIAHFGFDRAGKINRIYVGTRKKAPQ